MAQPTVEQLHAVLLNTYNPDPAQRKQSEDHLEQFKAVPGYLPLLLQSINQPEVDKAVKQAAAIALKNNIKKSWQDHVERGPSPFSASDKAVLRGNSVGVLVALEDKSLRDLVAEAINQVAGADYPQAWPGLLDELLAHIQSGEVLRIHNALLALRKLAKRYEFKPANPPEGRAPLLDLIARAFPLLRQLFENLMANLSDEAAAIQNLCLKTFWSCTQFHLPLQVDPAAVGLEHWLRLMGQLLARRLPEPGEDGEPRGQPEDPEDRRQWPHWKVKKWLMQIISRFFSRYGNPNYADAEATPFAEFYSKQVAPQLLEPVLATLSLRPQGRYCTDRVVQLALCFVNSALEIATTYKLVKPHLDFLLFQVVFPLLCLKDEDLELFETDPQEFVRKANDPMEDYFDPKLSAVNVLVDLAKLRGRDALPRVLGFLTDTLNAYAAAPPDQRDHRRKDGALVALGALDELLKAKKKYAGSLEGLLVAHVFPEFKSQHGFMRCRAFWMIQRFSDIKFADANNVTLAVQATLQALQDPALPVQIEAAAALRFLIAVEGTEALLLPVLPDLLRQYFRIMGAIGNDVVVQALQLIIDKFGAHVAPHAAEITAQLCGSFLTYVAAGDEDDEAAMAAAQCLEAVTTVLESVNGHPALYPQLEASLLPVLAKVLGADGEFMEHLENALDVLSYLTYYGEGISAALWGLFPLLMQAFEQWAYDFVANMAVPLDNYISRGTEVFLAGATPDGTPYVQWVVGLVARVLAAEERQTEREGRRVAGLLMSVLHHCPGRVDAWAPAMLDAVLAKAARPELQDETYVTLYQVLASALYYNPLMTLQYFEHKQCTGSVFGLWLQKLQAGAFGTALARKLTALGLSACLQLPAAQLPPDMQALLPQLLAAAVQQLAKLQEGAGEEGDEEEDGEESEGGEGGAGEDEEEGYGSDQDVKTAEDDNYFGQMQGWVDNRAVAAFLAGEFDDSDDDEDYRSPIDDVDELAYFYMTFRGACEREGQVYQQVQASMAPEDQQRVQQVLDLASQRISAAPPAPVQG